MMKHPYGLNQAIKIMWTPNSGICGYVQPQESHVIC